MKVHQDMAAAMQAVGFNFQRGKRLWVRFAIDPEKVALKSAEWAATLGTTLEPWRRQDRHQRGLPTAAAVCGPGFGSGGSKLEVVLMATEFVRGTSPDSPWGRQQWNDRLPEFGSFVMVREQNNQRKVTWTWRLQDHELHGRTRYLSSLVKSRDAAGVRNECEAWRNVYPMWSGIRRQLQSLLRSAMKLWTACHSTPWPSITPNDLPPMIGFRAGGTARRRKPVADDAALTLYSAVEGRTREKSAPT